MAAGSHRQARRIRLAGLVQGVGFRPFVYRLAAEHRLAGWVQNQVGEVVIEVEGTAKAIDTFVDDLLTRAPPLARPTIRCNEQTVPEGLGAFEIIASSNQAIARIHVPADRFTCDDCLHELRDPADRRYRYPFINCTNCGPRYTLIDAMPYDRANTTMAGFPLCPECRQEYEDPRDRRFHAEPVACPDCGPQLMFQAADGTQIPGGDAAIDAAVQVLRAGAVIATKGIGGYHLMCDARSDRAVERLRARKRRPHKPLAVMFPPRGTDGLELMREAVQLSSVEADALRSPLRPIVLIRRRAPDGLSARVAPGLDELGVFLPYSALHQLLLDDFGGPLVATSGNLSGEPVLTDNEEATRRLAGIADAFLHHNRPIQRPADDSVLRRIASRVRPLRLGRGAAPLELTLPFEAERPVLAVGGQMKGAIALAWDRRAVVSPHIGEMDTRRSLEVFETVVADLQALYGVRAERVVVDAHPGYSTHRWAKDCGLTVVPVAHHYAHASALAGEHSVDEPMVVFTWDGVGLGPDGTLWGGETLVGCPGDWRRALAFRSFRLPGGERAGREPWRSAAALCWETGRVCPVLPDDAPLVQQAWQRRLNAPETSAVGRLFDAAAALLLDLREVSHEAQGPMQLEACARGEGRAVSLPIVTSVAGPARVDWAPLVTDLLNDRFAPPERAAGFHASLAQSIADQADWVRTRHAIDTVGLTGGVFQNRRLTETACHLLEQRGFEVLLSDSLPCNDGGLCFGQLIEASALARNSPDKQV